MTGRVRTIRDQFGYGFIRTKGVDFFFHREDFVGDWKALVKDFSDDVDIQVEFEPGNTEKGPRAANVHRLESAE